MLLKTTKVSIFLTIKILVSHKASDNKAPKIHINSNSCVGFYKFISKERKFQPSVLFTLTEMRIIEFRFMFVRVHHN
jgi:hypothetical protein